MPCTARSMMRSGMRCAMKDGGEQSQLVGACLGGYCEGVCKVHGRGETETFCGGMG